MQKLMKQCWQLQIQKSNRDTLQGTEFDMGSMGQSVSFIVHVIGMSCAVWQAQHDHGFGCGQTSVAAEAAASSRTDHVPAALQTELCRERGALGSLCVLISVGLNAIRSPSAKLCAAGELQHWLLAVLSGSKPLCSGSRCQSHRILAYRLVLPP